MLPFCSRYQDLSPVKIKLSKQLVCLMLLRKKLLVYHTLYKQMTLALTRQFYGS